MILFCYFLSFSTDSCFLCVQCDSSSFDTRSAPLSSNHNTPPFSIVSARNFVHGNVFVLQNYSLSRPNASRTPASTSAVKGKFCHAFSCSRCIACRQYSSHCCKANSASAFSFFSAKNVSISWMTATLSPKASPSTRRFSYLRMILGGLSELIFS